MVIYSRTLVESVKKKKSALNYLFIYTLHVPKYHSKMGLLMISLIGSFSRVE